MIKVIYNKTCGRCVQSEPLTSGMVGQTIHFEYSHDFDGLAVTAVFTDGKNTVDVVNPGNECVIPHEVLTTVGAMVKVGIYATKGNELVIPTIYANIGVVLKGADPSGDVSIDPTLPVWAQIQGIIGNLNDLDTEAKNNLVAAINEAAQTGGGGGSASIAMRVDGGYIQYSTDDGKTWINLIAEADLKGDPGSPGKDGHSPVVTATKSGKTTTISVDGTAIATVEDGTDGAPGVAGAPGKDGAGMDITGATVGQIAKITAVDDTGKPTAWVAVDMPSGGGERTFEKVVEMTTAEDAAVISISTDKNGNPLSMSEFYVAITTARNSEATENSNFSCNVLPDTVPSYIRNRSAIKGLTLFQDVYSYVMHYKVIGGMIVHEYTGRVRTRGSLNVAEYLENEKQIGVVVDKWATTGFLSPLYASNGASKIDSAGKMYCITFSADSTNCIFGAGTRVEVWAR